jgi:hypothetical protein
MGLSAGYLAKGLNSINAPSGIRKIATLLMQLEVSSIVSQNSKQIISMVLKTINFFRKKPAVED